MGTGVAALIGQYLGLDIVLLVILIALCGNIGAGIGARFWINDTIKSELDKQAKRQSKSSNSHSSYDDFEDVKTGHDYSQYSNYDNQQNYGFNRNQWNNNQQGKTKATQQPYGLDLSRFKDKRLRDKYLKRQNIALDPNASPNERMAALNWMIAADEGRVEGIKALPVTT